MSKSSSMLSKCGNGSSRKKGLAQGFGVEACGPKSGGLSYMAFTKEVNHGDYLVCEPILKYVEGGITLLSEIDIGKWSFFEFVGFLKQDVKIKGDLKLWWEGVDVGLKELMLDCHVVEEGVGVGIAKLEGVGGVAEGVLGMRC
ncbi:hypothetical protein HKD37_03G007321 [Glycine soja]